MLFKVSKLALHYTLHYPTHPRLQLTQRFRPPRPTTNNRPTSNNQQHSQTLLPVLPRISFPPLGSSGRYKLERPLPPDNIPWRIQCVRNNESRIPPSRPHTEEQDPPNSELHHGQGSNNKSKAAHCTPQKSLRRKLLHCERSLERVA